MPVLFLVWLLSVVFCSPLAAAPLVLTAAEQAWLDEYADKIVLGFERFFPPIEFSNQDGAFDGLSADLVAVLERQLKVTFRKRPAEWIDVLAGLDSGKIFLAPAIVNNSERARYTLFTPPFVQIPQVILTKKDVPQFLTLESMDGMRVAVVRGYASAALVRERASQSATVVEVANVREGLHALSFGVVDAFVENLGVAAYFSNQEGLSNLRVAGDIGVSQDLCIGVSTHYPLLASIMTKALASVPTEERNVLIKRWIHLSSATFSPQTIQAIKLAAFFTFIALSILSVLAWFLRRRLKEKIQALKHAQTNLRDQLGRLILTLEMAKAGLWEFFPTEGREEHSPEWYTMLGYEPQAGSSDLNDWMRLMHPDDRKQSHERFLEYVQSGGPGDYESKHRMLTKDGSWRWILSKGRTVEWDEHGSPVHIIGLNLDIHEIKMTQEKAQKAQAFINALLEQSKQFIGLIDHDGILRLANHTALDWAGAAKNEVIGKPFFSCPWWPDAPAAKALLDEIFAHVMDGGTVRREVTHRKPDGTLVPFDFTASPFLDESGEVVSIIAEGRDISRQKKSESILAESEQRFRTIFAYAPYSIVISRLSDGRYMDANNAFLTRMGLTRERLAFLTMDDLGRFPKEHRQFVRTELQLGRTVHNLTTQAEYPDGTTEHLLYSGALVTLGGEPCVLSMTTDITGLKKAQEALRKSQKLFERLFQLSPDMIVLSRYDDGTLLEVNDTFCRSSGHARHEAIGRTAVDLGLFVMPQLRQTFAKTLLRDKVVDNFELDFRHRDGQILKCSASLRLITVDDSLCILSITRDVTQLHAMQNMMIQSEKMLSLGGIAAGIAHEINNPLGVVLQAAQTMALRIKPDFPKNLDAAASLGVDLQHVHAYLHARKIPVFLRDVEQAAIRAAGIVRHMLDFSRKSESRRCACHLPTIIESALTLVSNDYDLKKRYDFRQINITREFPDECPLLYCTETEIEQVVLNILRNAAQAMADMTPPLAHPRIRLSIIILSAMLRLEIEDNGPGIPENIRSRIFDPFFTTKAPGSGTGLGLSVSYFIITKGHHGHLSAQPGQEGGTIFCIDLPRTDAEPECQ